MRTGTLRGPIVDAFSRVSAWLQPRVLWRPAVALPRRRGWMARGFNLLAGKDAWMGSLAGDKDHRVFIDSASGVGGATAVLYANNILSAHQEDYAGADDEYAIIVCFRHAATALGYTDAMWEKYGEVFSRVTRLSVPGGDSPLAVNPLNLEGANFGNIGNTLDHVRGRGVHFAICNRATHSMSRRLSAVTGQSAASHYAELIQENITKSRFVPAGVMAATRSQEYGYSLLSAG